VTASKERDLILAAELGKALLEKNEELRNLQNEKKFDEFTKWEKHFTFYTLKSIVLMYIPVPN
jgi:hypothetical protein